MNTDELKKLYRDVQNAAVPDFWDKIDAGLKPHSELNKEEKNALAEFEENCSEAELYRKKRKKAVMGWAAAAAVFVIVLPAVLLLSGTGTVWQASAEAEAEAMEAAVQTQAAVMEAEAMPEMAAPENAAMPEMAAPEEREAAVQAETAAAEKAVETVLLTVPEDAAVISADSAYFTEEILADTDMLAIVTVDTASFVSDTQGTACQLAYDVTVRESLLEEGESGKEGSSLRVLSPIVSDGTPGGSLLYQLVPGQTYILPLKKKDGDWQLLCPTSPQILLREDGSFVFHTGYTDLINDETEIVFDTQASEDDFWFDRKVSRSDENFIPELTELVKFEKKSE